MYHNTSAIKETARAAYPLPIPLSRTARLARWRYPGRVGDRVPMPPRSFPRQAR